MLFSLEQKPSEQVALWEDSGAQITYGKLRLTVREFGSCIKERSLVFCLCKNTIGSVIGYLGCLQNNQVALLLEAGMEEEMQQELFDTYQPAYVWIPLDKKGEMQKFIQDQVFSAAGYGLFQTKNYPYRMYEKLALLLTTSGSVGNPKLVRLSMDNIQANAASIMEYLNLKETERPITTLPMQYTYGLSVINSHLLAGGCILLTEKSIVQQEFWRFLTDAKATSFAGVPYTYELLKKLKILQRALPDITSITQAGGKLPVSLQQEFGTWANEHGIKFTIMYGQTEATARMSYLPHTMCLKKPGSIGIPIPGGRFFLKDTDGTILEEPEKTGELIYEGANVSLGYAKSMEDLSRGDEHCGILETGDMAKRDCDGYYYIVGRKKRFIKLFGVRIGLDECEQLLFNQFPGVDFACTGEDNQLRIYTTGETLADTVCDWLSTMLHLNRNAFSAVYLAVIPKTDAGKTRYAALQ